MTSRHDFPEDFTHENGMYFNTCCQCNVQFLGYKRRVVCKVCEETIKNDSIESSVRRDILNRFYPTEDQLEIAIGSVVHKEKVIANLREQINNLHLLLKQSGVDDIIIEQHQYKHLAKQESNDD